MKFDFFYSMLKMFKLQLLLVKYFQIYIYEIFFISINILFYFSEAAIEAEVQVSE